MRKTVWWLSLAIVLLPAFALADCVDLGRYTGWIFEASHTVLFYDGKTPLARVEIPYCEIPPLSTIRLFNSYVCDSDEIYGERCRLPYHYRGKIVLEDPSSHSCPTWRRTYSAALRIELV